MKTKISWKNILKSLITLICIFILVWFIASFVDTNICNNPCGEHYQDFASWNLFVNFLD